MQRTVNVILRCSPIIGSTICILQTVNSEFSSQFVFIFASLLCSYPFLRTAARWSDGHYSVLAAENREEDKMWNPDLALFGHVFSFDSVSQREEPTLPKYVSVQPPAPDPDFTFTNVKLSRL